VFTVRIHTATARKAAIDHPDAGVQICLFGGKAALMHRIGQMEQATDARDMMEEVCEVRIRLTDVTSDSYTHPLLAQHFRKLECKRQLFMDYLSNFLCLFVMFQEPFHASRANYERSFCYGVAVRSKSCLQLFGLVRRD
jgi:hypothetical protein